MEVGSKGEKSGVMEEGSGVMGEGSGERGGVGTVYPLSTPHMCVLGKAIISENEFPRLNDGLYIKLSQVGWGSTTGFLYLWLTVGDSD